MALGPYAVRHGQRRGTAHLGVLGVDLEHAEDDDEEDAVAGDDDGPRRRLTALERFRGARAILQEGVAQQEVQKDGRKRTVSIEDGRQRI